MSAKLGPSRELVVDSLRVQIYPTRADMGRAAAHAVADAIRRVFAARPKARIIFAAAPSQNEMLAELAAIPDLDWSRVEAFHMDEYVGLAPDAPQRFGNYLRQHIFDLVRPGIVEYIDGNAPDPEAECERYAHLLLERPIDIVCAGIGENGHIAFNDPHVADFADKKCVKTVALDETSRMQQVHDGAFASLAEVPKLALTITVPGLIAAREIYAVVPGPTKAKAIKATLQGPIGEACPATALRRHPRATLYVDEASAALL